MLRRFSGVMDALTPKLLTPIRASFLTFSGRRVGALALADEQTRVAPELGPSCYAALRKTRNIEAAAANIARDPDLALSACPSERPCLGHSPARRVVDNVSFNPRFFLSRSFSRGLSPLHACARSFVFCSCWQGMKSWPNARAPDQMMSLVASAGY